MTTTTTTGSMQIFVKYRMFTSINISAAITSANPFIDGGGVDHCQTIAVDITDRTWGCDVQALIESKSISSYHRQASANESIDRFGLSVNDQRLVFAGKELNSLLPMTLAWGVKNGDTLECFLRDGGGHCDCCGHPWSRRSRDIPEDQRCNR
jgi:hypothetical protein